MQKPPKTPKKKSPQAQFREGVADEYRQSGPKMREYTAGSNKVSGQDMLPEESAEPDRTKKPFNTQKMAKGGVVKKPKNRK